MYERKGFLSNRRGGRTFEVGGGNGSREEGIVIWIFVNGDAWKLVGETISPVGERWESSKQQEKFSIKAGRNVPAGRHVRGYPALGGEK